MKVLENVNFEGNNRFLIVHLEKVKFNHKDIFYY